MAIAPIRPRPLPRIIRTRDVGDEYVRSATRTGALIRAVRGAYVEPVRGEPRWREQEHLALARAAATSGRLKNGAVLSHATAALVHGCWVWEVDPRVHVTQTGKPNGRRPPDVVRHCGALTPADVTVVNGLRVTTLERTLLDCAATLHPRDALVVADSALRALVRPDRFDREASREAVARTRRGLLAALSTRMRQGRRRTRAVIAHADPLSESPYESALRWIAVAGGLPVPIAQLRVETRRGVYYADLGWRLRQVEDRRTITERLVLAEFDGEIKYLPDDGDRSSARAASEVLVAEKRREDALREVPGVAIRRFDRRDLRDEASTFARLCAAFPAPMTARLRPVADLMPPASP